MPFGDPSATSYDLSFQLFGIPIRIQPWFWLIALMLSQGTTGGDPGLVAVWIVAMLVSLLVHELGHAFLQRWYGGRPRIVLYGLGGMASAEGVRLTPWRQIAISLAGPFAGFALAGLVWAAAEYTPITDQPAMIPLITYLLLINIFWGVFNLLPIYPLDGGHVSRELLTLVMRPHWGIVVSLWLSIVCCAAAAAWLWMTTQSVWNLMLMAFLAVNNYQTLEAYKRSRGGGW